VIFVAGASSGIGESAVRLFAREGAKVVSAARRLKRMEVEAQVLNEAGLTVAPVECDVRDETSVAHAIDFAIERFGRLDGAFNNAGEGNAQGSLHEFNVEVFDRVMGTNLRGVFFCLKHEISAMLRTGGGSIVNTSSAAGLTGMARNSLYAASKFGLAGMIKSAAVEYARQGIRVNAIGVGPTDTAMFRRWATTENERARAAEMFPMNYIAQPEDMARAALFLLSDEARWTTGVVLPCEGGKTAGW
jgi:NAD(P)-dependent dehydrogenase (short-subunit alcohol dehydrogenase family)